MGKMLDLNETARLYGITPNGARTWISRGKIVNVNKIDSTYYIDEDESKALVTKNFKTKYERKLGSDHSLAYIGETQILLRGKLFENEFKDTSEKEFKWLYKYALSKARRKEDVLYIIIGPVEESFERFIADKKTFLISAFSVQALFEKIYEKKRALAKKE